MELDLANTTTTSLSTTVVDFSVSPRQTDGVNSGEGVTRYNNENFTKWFGYYKVMPELKKPIDALATYATGKGYQCDDQTKALLEHITGMGEDTFEDIAWNMIVTKKINGDAYAEIVRAPKREGEAVGRLINLKPLDPSIMTTLVDEKGIIIGYEQRSKTDKGTMPKTFKPYEIFHIMNDRIADEIHGTGIVEVCQWVIDAKNEAMRDRRRVLHRSTIRVIEYDSNDTTKRDTLKTQYAQGVKNGEVLLVPKGSIGFPDVPPLIHDSDSWIKYLDNFIYVAVGVPKVVTGGSEEFTEASSKISLVTFDQLWAKEQAEFSADFWNQVYLKITWNKPTSLMNELISDEEKNTGQLGFQPNDVTAGSGKA